MWPSSSHSALGSLEDHHTSGQSLGSIQINTETDRHESHVELRFKEEELSAVELFMSSPGLPSGLSFSASRHTDLMLLH